MGRPRVVIVGGGFGGLLAARGLAHADVDVTVVDRENYHLFQPLLYQVATAGLSPGEIASPIRSILRRYENVRVLMGEVQRVDVEGRRVVLADEVLPYDQLILAAGARHSYFGHPEWEGTAPGLKSLDDALEIRRRILLAFEAAEREPDEAARAAWLTFVVVGGGATGVELAGSITEIARHTVAHDFRNIDPTKARVLLLEAGPRVLPAFDEALSAKAQASLERLGVEVRTGTAVTGVSDTRVQLGAEAVATRTTLWAAGVAANPLGKSLGVPLDRSGRVVVEADLSIPGHPEVSVVGDMASFTHGTERPLPGVAPVAMQMGKHAARNALLALAGKPREPFRYKDRGSMATIGRAAGIADVWGLKLSGYLGWLAWLFLHLVFLIGFKNRLLVLIQWTWSYLTYRRGARLITGRTQLVLPHGGAEPREDGRPAAKERVRAGAPRA